MAPPRRRPTGFPGKGCQPNREDSQREEPRRLAGCGRMDCGRRPETAVIRLERFQQFVHCQACLPEDRPEGTLEGTKKIPATHLGQVGQPTATSTSTSSAGLGRGIPSFSAASR